MTISSGRKGDGGTYLVIADETEEFPLTLEYAAIMAKARRAHICMAFVIDSADFQHWGDVEAMMQKELREKAEKKIWQFAKDINEKEGIFPSLIIIEGNPETVIPEIISENEKITALVLGANTGSGGAGPLVHYFTSKGLSKLEVPLLLVPSHLSAEKIERIA